MKVQSFPLFQARFWSDSLVMTKPRITLLALITAVAGMKMAPAPMEIGKTFFTLLGISLLVGGASSLNMFLERDVDELMERTRSRPLPDKRLSPEYGLGLGSVLVGLALPTLFYGVNALTGWIGCAAMGIYVLVYTPLKKHSWISLWLGAIPGAAPPLMGWAAGQGTLAWPAWILFAIMFIWQIPHFLAIGTFRKEEYAQAGFKIFPQQAAPWSIKLQTVLLSFLLLPLSACLYYLNYAGIFYLLSAVALGLALLACTLYEIREANALLWGRRVFLASLIYLTGLFGAVFIDGGPQ